MLSIYKILYLLPCKAMEHLLCMTHYVDEILFWETIKAIILVRPGHRLVYGVLHSFEILLHLED
jgi:hypothetical protein